MWSSGKYPFFGRQSASPFFLCSHQAPAQHAKRTRVQTRESAYSSGMDSVVTVVWPPSVDHCAMTVSTLKTCWSEHLRAWRQYLKQVSEALDYFAIRYLNKLANSVQIRKAFRKSIAEICSMNFGQCAVSKHWQNLVLLHSIACLIYWWLPVWNNPFPA